MTKRLNKQSKEIISFVHNFMKKELENGVGNIKQVQKRTALATRTSVATVRRIIKEITELSDVKAVVKYRQRLKPITGLEKFDYTAIRRRIHDYHITETEMPSMERLCKTMQEDIKFKGSSSSLRRIIRNMGFKRKITEKSKKILVEAWHIRYKRIEYLQHLLKYRAEGRPIVYTDEVCLDSTVPILEPCSQHPGNKKPISSKQRVMLVHAASEAGLLTNTLLTFQGDVRNADYHDDMTFEDYEVWLRTHLLPNLPENSVVVVDNFLYHKKQCDPVPTPTSKRSAMIAWLNVKGIKYDEDMLKPQLYNLIKLHKDKHNKFKIDAILAEYNHTVLRLPPYHRDLNPMDAAWNVVKDYVNTKIENWSFKEVTDLVRERFQTMNGKEWTGIVENLGIIEESYTRSDYVADVMTEEVIVGGEDDDSISSDDDLSYDGIDDDDEDMEMETCKVKIERDTDWMEEEAIY